MVLKKRKEHRESLSRRPPQNVLNFVRNPEVQAYILDVEDKGNVRLAILSVTDLIWPILYG